MHFIVRNDAEKAMDGMNNKDLHGSAIEVMWATPPIGNQKRQDLLRAREKRMMTNLARRPP